MYLKFFEKQINLNDENNQSFDLKYIIEASKDFDDYVYGFKVQKYIEDKLIDEANANNITQSKEEAEFIIQMLIDSLVTPVTLFYIIDDFVSKKEEVI